MFALKMYRVGVYALPSKSTLCVRKTGNPEKMSRSVGSSIKGGIKLKGRVLFFSIILSKSQFF